MPRSRVSSAAMRLARVVAEDRPDRRAPLVAIRPMTPYPGRAIVKRKGARMDVDLVTRRRERAEPFSRCAHRESR